MGVLLFVVRRRARAPKSSPEGGKHILLTATFYSQQWIKSQLEPLLLAQGISRVTFVSTTPVDDIDGLDVIYPPTLLRKIIGGVPSRLLTFLWQGIRLRPDIVGGYHLLINGLVALLTARLARAASLYICVGGPTELDGGGYATENRIFGKLAGPDPDIERQLLSAADRFDMIVVRGKSAEDYLASHGVTAPTRIITAGVDAEVFSPGEAAAEYDLVFLARLSQVKRVRLFLECVELLRDTYSDGIRALIIGDGPDRESAERFIAERGLANNVHMVGQQAEVAGYLRSARVYVLTSKSEGLSQAMVQGMLCGLPAVVANVGSLADLVENGRSGYLVDDHNVAENYATPITALLSDTGKMGEMSVCARDSAMRCSTGNVAARWNALAMEIV